MIMIMIVMKQAVEIMMVVEIVVIMEVMSEVG